MKRLRGRRTPHQDLEGPLIEITQPSISNQWATGGPPLVLISHPSGMTPDEERFHSENRSTWFSQNWAWVGTPICPHLSRKRAKGWRITGVPPLEDSVPESWTTKQTRETSPPQGACKSPKKGPEKKNNKGKSDKTEQSPRETQSTVPMSFPP